MLLITTSPSYPIPVVFNNKYDTTYYYEDHIDKEENGISITFQEFKRLDDCVKCLSLPFLSRSRL